MKRLSTPRFKINKINNSRKRMPMPVERATGRRCPMVKSRPMGQATHKGQATVGGAREPGQLSVGDNGRPLCMMFNNFLRRRGLNGLVDKVSTLYDKGLSETADSVLTTFEATVIDREVETEEERKQAEEESKNREEGARQQNDDDPGVAFPFAFVETADIRDLSTACHRSRWTRRETPARSKADSIARLEAISCFHHSPPSIFLSSYWARQEVCPNGNSDGSFPSHGCTRADAERQEEGTGGRSTGKVLISFSGSTFDSFLPSSPRPSINPVPSSNLNFPSLSC